MLVSYWALRVKAVYWLDCRLHIFWLMSDSSQQWRINYWYHYLGRTQHFVELMLVLKIQVFKIARIIQAIQNYFLLPSSWYHPILFWCWVLIKDQSPPLLESCQQLCAYSWYCHSDTTQHSSPIDVYYCELPYFISEDL